MEKDISVAISEKMEKTMAVLRKELGKLEGWPCKSACFG